MTVYWLKNMSVIKSGKGHIEPTLPAKILFGILFGIGIFAWIVLGAVI